MLAESACELIGNVIYKPGWLIEPKVNLRFEHAIAVKVTYPATNSDRDQAAKGYPNMVSPMGPHATFTILVKDLDDVQLFAALAEILMTIEEHEMREFLRIAPNYWSPFHPHHTNGIRRWAEVTGRDYKSVLQADLTFGVGD